ncbi:MAG: YggS family pyridoxal phosphate-dependent enzyme [Methylococcales bacterium]|nr:YggS family pyridoxal phosphate-dependent enzyme [Methylococcales bacterium]
MKTLKQNFYSVRSQIHQAEMMGGRANDSVKLIAVSKTKPAKDIATLHQLGQQDFGENYLQEALEKQQQLATLNLIWHFIGPIQSNKTKAIAENFSWVHSVERLKIAQRLSHQRPAHLPPLNICLQVNISNEPTKSGVDLQALPSLITEVNALENIRLRGVMAIPAPETDYDLQCQPYRKLYQQIKALNLSTLDTFSFGMTGDLNAAVAEGSTMIRIGTALFGKRVKP